MAYKFGPFLSQYWVDDVTTLSQDFKSLEGSTAAVNVLGINELPKKH